MSLEDLTNSLASMHPDRFRDITDVERAIDTYSGCLSIKGGFVEYNRTSARYSKTNALEPAIQYFLHTSFKNMEEWQLYPLPVNSE